MEIGVVVQILPFFFSRPTSTSFLSNASDSSRGWRMAVGDQAKSWSLCGCMGNSRGASATCRATNGRYGGGEIGVWCMYRQDLVGGGGIELTPTPP